MSTPAIPAKAMVFAAGLGKRMRPLTEHMPKPLIPVGGKAMLDHALDLLAAGGVTQAVVNAAYLKEQIIAHVAQRSGLPQVVLSIEDAPLETGGGVIHAWQHLADAPFFAMNSDIVLVPGATNPIARLWNLWSKNPQLDALLLVMPMERAIGFDGAGDFVLDTNGTPRFRRSDEASAPYVFTGLQLLHPRLFIDAPAEPFSLNRLYRQLCDAATQPGAAPRIHAIVHDGDWLHIGDPEGLRKAERYYSSE
jgi:MurNAc alpha-1-phosphate uridylyltransferase